MALSASADGVGEVFLKASCFSGSAFSWRGRPVFGLRDGGDLSHLHALLEVLQSLLSDQLLATTLMHPALEKLLDAALLVGGEPPLALTPGVAQSLGCF